MTYVMETALNRAKKHGWRVVRESNTVVWLIHHRPQRQAPIYIAVMSSGNVVVAHY